MVGPCLPSLLAPYCTCGKFGRAVTRPPPSHLPPYGLSPPSVISASGHVHRLPPSLPPPPPSVTAHADAAAAARESPLSQPRPRQAQPGLPYSKKAQLDSMLFPRGRPRRIVAFDCRHQSVREGVLSGRAWSLSASRPIGGPQLRTGAPARAHGSNAALA